MSDDGNVDYGVSSGWSTRESGVDSSSKALGRAWLSSKETPSEKGVSSRRLGYTTDVELLAEVMSGEENSLYAEVRASVSNFDDPDTPCLTFRSWTLGLTFSSLLGAANGE